MMAMLLAVAMVASSASAVETCRVGDPFVATAKMPGMSRYPMGIVVAVWPDGRILRAKVASDPRKGHIAGQLSEAQMARLTKFVGESGIWRLQQPGMPFDVSEDLIAVCAGDRRRSLSDMPGRHPQSPQRRLESYLRNIKVREPRAAGVPDEWINWFRWEDSR